MSFLKISDPTKRDQTVKEYLELKKNIRDNLLSERTGEQQLQTELTKFYKPITEAQKATAREITEGYRETTASLLHPGQATTMLGLLKYPDDFSKSKGLNQLWYKDTTSTAVLADNVGFKIRHDCLINNSRPRGSFSFRIPLKHIFGFGGDYDKVVY